MEGKNFRGFRDNTCKFLKDLGKNNEKKWFETHRREYNEYLLTPLQNLVVDMGEFMLTIDPYFEIRPMIDKTISRIYRDTRFSPDKSLYRSNMWIVFKRPNKNWKDAPAYFFEIYPDWYRYGMGFYQASKDTMDAFREEIRKEPTKFLRIISKIKSFEIKGELYKRPLWTDLPQEIQKYYQRKSFYMEYRKSIDEILFSPKLVDELVQKYEILRPLYLYLLDIKEKVRSERRESTYL
ncbi:MAG: DUF2461 domain-containing protein [bacterium]